MNKLIGLGLGASLLIATNSVNSNETKKDKRNLTFKQFQKK